MQNGGSLIGDVNSALVSYDESRRFESCRRAPQTASCRNGYLGHSGAEKGKTTSCDVDQVILPRADRSRKTWILTPYPLGISMA